MTSPVEVPNKIIWFGYPASPYAHRVKDYLALRNIAYAECVSSPQLHVQHHAGETDGNLDFTRAPATA